MLKTLLPVLLALLMLACQNEPQPINYGNFDIKKTAQKPPMGWNSWDVFGADVNEAEVKKMTDYMAANLKPAGYEYIVIDIAWYAPNATAIDEKYKEPYPEQLIDQYGRLIPSPNKFPSCKDGSFKPLADYVHSKGLKFGFHVMRGIPRQAVEQNTPIKGTKYKARDIVMYEKTCSFYDGMLSIDMEKPGAQEYYNSVLELYAEWGTDFIKADDMTSYPIKFDEIKAFRYALEQCGRPMVLSLSPGSVNSWDRSFLTHYADMYRISGDFWDEWTALKRMFTNCHTFKGHTGPGHWADCDMIPLGIINTRGERGTGERKTNFTPDEQYTLMTLWTIYRSPLMLGMDLTKLDSFTLKLLTNDNALKINKKSTNNQEVFHSDSLVVWRAESPDNDEIYVAAFNLSDSPMNWQLQQGGAVPEKHGQVFDIWANTATAETTFQLAPHGCKYLIIKP